MDVRIEWVEESWEGAERLKAMLYAVLYRPYGVQPDDDWYHQGEGEIAVALSADGRHLLGSVRLLGCPGDESRQLRQIAVEPALQRQGVGRALVLAVESRAAEMGTSELWLNARDTAYPFYASLGYHFDGETFVSELTRIPHRRMARVL